MSNFYETILALPVWDTHTHVNSKVEEPLVSHGFWDLGHYFWFRRELTAADYPTEQVKMSDPERRERYFAAYMATKNTAINWAFTHMLHDLFGVKLTSPKSIEEADEAIRAKSTQSGRAKEVVDRLAIKRITINSFENIDYPNLPGVGHALPGLPDVDGMVKRVLDAKSPAEELGKCRNELNAEIGAWAEKGVRGVRMAIAPLDRLGAEAYAMPDDLPKTGATAEHVAVLLLRERLRALEGQKIFAQLFLGIQETTAKTAMPINDPHRITNLHGMFERYECGFEILMGCELNNMDLVQAAVVFPNVFAGGLWWYNFRPSMFRQCMQYRMEVLPPLKSTLVASDATCIEWCYAKVLLIKTLLAEFLWEQIDRGWLDRETALYVAKSYLHDAAEARYLNA